MNAVADFVTAIYCITGTDGHLSDLMSNLKKFYIC